MHYSLRWGHYSSHRYVIIIIGDSLTAATTTDNISIVSIKMAAIETEVTEFQKEEIIAVSSIYEDNFTKISDNSFEIKIECEEDKWWSLTIRVMLPTDYPKNEAPLCEIFTECLNGEELEEIYKGLGDIWEEYKGECVIFMWIEKAKEILNEKQEQSLKKQKDLKRIENYVVNDGGQKPLIESPTIGAVFEANLAEGYENIVDHLKDDGNMMYAGKKNPSVNPSSMEINSPEIMSGDTIIDRKSIFQAHVAYVETEEEVKTVMQRLKENRKIARATHNIMAYRIEGSRKDTYLQDYDDDGENEAGGRLMHLLRILDVKNIVVVVSRWYGGILLGPDRFKHINNCARELIVHSGIFKESKEEDLETNGHKKNKKKPKKNK